MENILLTNLNETLESNSYLFDGKKCDIKHLSFAIKEEGNVSILFLNITDELDIDFKIASRAFVKFSFLQEEGTKLFIKGSIDSNAHLDCYYADFAKGNVELATDIHLVGREATCIWNLASLTKDKDHKRFDISIYHDAIKTYCEINNYGVARDSSKLMFSGICKIEKGAHESVAHQNSKIMVFDEQSDAIAKPILKIDDNDIEASHAAVVGKISDDHLFYMTSRGLSLSEARELITYGYLKPILNGFNDDELQNRISQMIEGEF